MDNTLSLLELLDMLERETGKRSEISYHDWRPSDQKVYISDISKVQQELGWRPEVNPGEGVERIARWVEENIGLF